MGQTVRQLYVARRKDSWWQLTDEEREALHRKVLESIEANGGRVVTGAYCEWSTAEYEFFGVEEYPSIQALRRHLAATREMGHSQHFEEISFVGTPWEEED